MFQSIRAYGQSFSFLRKHGLLYFLWFPLVITALVIWGGSELTKTLTETLFEALIGWMNPDNWLPEGWDFVVDVIYWLLWVLFRILLYFAFAFVGGSVVLILMSPVLTLLSEKVAEKLGHPIPGFSLPQFFRDLLRAIGLAVRNGAIQLLLSLGCFVIGFIPVVGLAAPFLLFAINAYFYGYSLMDYSMERKQLDVRESQRYVWQHKFKTLGLGAPFALWMLVPFFGPMSSGFVALLGTVAATRVVEGEAKPKEIVKA